VRAGIAAGWEAALTADATACVAVAKVGAATRGVTAEVIWIRGFFQMARCSPIVPMILAKRPGLIRMAVAGAAATGAGAMAMGAAVTDAAATGIETTGAATMLVGAAATGAATKLVGAAVTGAATKVGAGVA
jgi:hypothetical protein